ncbi:RidA family protein [Bradyrhizobium iriomotense]|uniref:RidA family protein n=2 Tax=Bradyrhizobium iriomotense TaxID=441950 RepID=UPI0032DE3FA7
MRNYILVKVQRAIDDDSAANLFFYFQSLIGSSSECPGRTICKHAKSPAATPTWKCAICRPSPQANIGLIMIQRVLPYEGLLHEVVEHNGVLYIGGIVPEDTSLDMSGQASDVLGQLARLLKTLGSDLANVLQVTIYMTDLKEKAQFNAAWKAHFAEAHLPARAAIGVADLGPGVKLEMTAIAARQ